MRGVPLALSEQEIASALGLRPAEVSRQQRTRGKRKRPLRLVAVEPTDAQRCTELASSGAVVIHGNSYSVVVPSANSAAVLGRVACTDDNAPTVEELVSSCERRNCGLRLLPEPPLRRYSFVPGDEVFVSKRVQEGEKVERVDRHAVVLASDDGDDDDDGSHVVSVRLAGDEGPTLRTHRRQLMRVLPRPIVYVYPTTALHRKLASTQVRREDTVLEIGCDMGECTARVAARCEGKALGVDLSPQASGTAPLALLLRAYLLSASC